MIIDIREDNITGIKFDDTKDEIRFGEDSLIIMKALNGEEYVLSLWEDFDNFIKACHKAKELAGK